MCGPAIPALRKQRQEGYEGDVSLGVQGTIVSKIQTTALPWGKELLTWFHSFWSSYGICWEKNVSNFISVY